MTIMVVGDIHGDSRFLAQVADTIPERHPEVTAIIQVGDFGFYPGLIDDFQRVNSTVPIYAIDGNHEHFPMLTGITEVTEMFPNIFYVPRGTVLEIDGGRVAFCGGAASVDKDIRLRQKMSWFAEEQIQDSDIEKLDDVDSVDLLITHCPPQSVIQKNFDPRMLAMFGLPSSWRDPSADKIETLWERLGYPTLLCGHMHRSVQDRSCRILDINEVVLL
jgi:predicted phosphodiesterase